MPKFRTTLTGAAISTVLIAGSLIAAPAARATEAPAIPTSVVGRAGTGQGISPAVFDQAIAEARAAGAITAETLQADGTRTVTIDAGGDASLELSAPGAGQRLSAGSDSYGGVFVGFNAFDQNIIISGAAAGLTAGICLLGPAVCAVATIAITVATVVVSMNGGVRCGTKSLRVYPISNKKPRCA